MAGCPLRGGDQSEAETGVTPLPYYVLVPFLVVVISALAGALVFGLIVIRAIIGLADGKRPKAWPTYSLRYLLLVVFRWALALGLSREVFNSLGSYEYRSRCLILSAVAWGGAYGGIALRMRFGLLAGTVIGLAVSGLLIWMTLTYH
jgi:hypothetical protein